MENSERIRKLEKIKRAYIKLMTAVDPTWKCPGGGQPLLYMNQGLDYMEKRYFPNGLTDERIIDCLIYQVYRYRELIGQGRFDYRWCFSTNAIDKFYNQFFGGGKGRGMTYYINQWLDSERLSRKQLVDIIADPKQNPYLQYLYMHSEEMAKQRFLNTEVGYLMCLNNTTGWSPLSECCKQCKFTEKCIKESEHKYPEIIRLRKEYRDGKS